MLELLCRGPGVRHHSIILYTRCFFLPSFHDKTESRKVYLSRVFELYKASSELKFFMKQCVAPSMMVGSRSIQFKIKVYELRPKTLLRQAEVQQREKAPRFLLLSKTELALILQERNAFSLRKERAESVL